MESRHQVRKQRLRCHGSDLADPWVHKIGDVSRQTAQPARFQKGSTYRYKKLYGTSSCSVVDG